MRDLITDAQAIVEVEDRSYVGIVLDKPSHERLLSWWKQDVKLPLLSKVFAHHQTLVFRPTPEDLAKLPVGDKVTLRVIGWAADDRAQAVQVSSPHPGRSAVAHITIAVSADTQPVYSNALLAHHTTRVHGPTLSGTVEHVVNIKKLKPKV